MYSKYVLFVHTRVLRSGVQRHIIRYCGKSFFVVFSEKLCERSNTRSQKYSVLSGEVAKYEEVIFINKTGELIT